MHLSHLDIMFEDNLVFKHCMNILHAEQNAEMPSKQHARLHDYRHVGEICKNDEKKMFQCL